MLLAGDRWHTVLVSRNWSVLPLRNFEGWHRYFEGRNRYFEGRNLYFEGWNRYFEGWNRYFEGWNRYFEDWNRDFEGWNPYVEGWNRYFGGWNRALATAVEAAFGSYKVGDVHIISMAYRLADLLDSDCPLTKP